MKIDRKTFVSTLAGGAVGLFASATAAGSEKILRSADRVSSFRGSEGEDFWRLVRGEYLLETGYRYFNTGGLGPTPGRVLIATEECARHLQRKSEGGRSLIDNARSQLASFLGANASEIAFARNTTEGNSIIASGLNLCAGDEVILESHAHPGGSYPWFAQQQYRGIKVRIFEPSFSAPEENIDRIKALITEKTRVIQVSHITAPTGIVMPVDAIARLCKDRGIWFHVDGAQAVGMIPVDLHQLGCDSYASSGHKWLGAPHETGVLFVKDEKIDALAPYELGGNGAELDRLPGELQIKKSAVRFESGTRSASLVVGVAAAVNWMNSLNMQRVADRGNVLVKRIRDGLSGLRDVEILTPKEPGFHASMITFRTPRIGYREICSRLLTEHRCRCRAVSEQGLDAVRISAHLCTLPEECDALIEGVEKITKTA